MIFLDSSILVAALVEDEDAHESCLRLLARRGPAIWSHALAEVYSTLTGGRLGFRIAPGLAAELIETSLRPRLQLFDLPTDSLLAALQQAEPAGARGGALYDFLHLFVARESGARQFYTLNERHFTALARPGDPRIEMPAAPKPE